MNAAHGEPLHEREREREQLREGASALAVPLQDEQLDRLMRLLDLLERWNGTYNLTALRTREAMLRGHLLDSLSVHADVLGARVADVGTGGGFPGLPLAIAAPERAFTLIDSVGKKIRFVGHACRELGLVNVTALQTRVETLAPEQPVDTVVARAYAELPQLLKSVQGLCGPATRVIAMKGRYPHAELAGLPPHWRLEGVRAVQIPGLPADRHILRLVPDAPAARLAGS